MNEVPHSRRHQLLRQAKAALQKASAELRKIEARVGGKLWGSEIRFFPSHVEAVAHDEGISLATRRTRQLLEFLYWLIVIAVALLWGYTFIETTLLEGFNAVVMGGLFAALSLGLSTAVRFIWHWAGHRSASEPPQSIRAGYRLAWLAIFVALAIEASVVGVALLRIAEFTGLGGADFPASMFFGAALASGAVVLLAALIGHQKALYEIANVRALRRFDQNLLPELVVATVRHEQAEERFRILRSVKGYHLEYRLGVADEDEAPPPLPPSRELPEDTTDDDNDGNDGNSDHDNSDVDNSDDDNGDDDSDGDVES